MADSVAHLWMKTMSEMLTSKKTQEITAFPGFSHVWRDYFTVGVEEITASINPYSFAS